MLNDIAQPLQRHSRRFHAWWRTAQDRPTIKYVKDQVYLDKIIPALMVLGWFGYIPYFFTALVVIGVPLAVLRRHTIAARVLGGIEFLRENTPARLLREWGQRRASTPILQPGQNVPVVGLSPKLRTKHQLKQWCEDKLSDFSKNWLFHILPVYLFLSFTFAPAFFAIYGYYSLGPQKFLDTAKHIVQRLFRGVLDKFKAMPARQGETEAQAVARRNAYLRQQVLSYSVLVVLLALLYGIGFTSFFMSIFSLGTSLALMLAPIVGFAVFVRDGFRALTHPLGYGTLYMGPYLGAMWGRSMAYLVFHGNLTGNLSRVMGHVSTTSLLTMAGATFMETVPESLRFLGFSPTGAVGSMLDAMSTHHVVMGAEFTGYAGPTNAALYLFMMQGAAYGWVVHQISKIFYSEFKAEIANIYQDITEYRSRRINNALYNHRWSLAYAATVSLFTFASPLTPMIMPFLGGSALVAMPVVGLSLATTIFMGKKLHARLETPVNRIFDNAQRFMQQDPTGDVQDYVVHELERVQPILPSGGPAAPLPANDDQLQGIPDNGAGIDEGLDLRNRM